MKRNDASDAASLGAQTTREIFRVGAITEPWDQWGAGRTIFTVLCTAPKGARHRDHTDFMTLHTVLSLSERIFFLWKYVS